MREKSESLTTLTKKFNINEILESEYSKEPFVNIYETNDDFVLIAEMPGVSREYVSLRIENNSLIIFGRINYHEAINRKYILNENSIGNYFRRFNISDNIDAAKISAQMENGQLIVTLPKYEKVKPRSIHIS